MAVSILKEDSTGPEVIDLQYILKLRGGKQEFDPGSVDGIFGAKTKASVIKFQKSKGLTVDGIVGEKTWQALGLEWPNKAFGDFLKEGEKGEAVKQLQQGLKSKNLYAGAIDGVFGATTKAAVIKIQKSGTQDSNIVGVVGPITWGGILGG
jgi:peptidoglycan hydrolase-like protein with peptidoglycan-binding domain